jgi:hypothetical protein
LSSAVAAAAVGLAAARKKAFAGGFSLWPDAKLAEEELLRAHVEQRIAAGAATAADRAAHAAVVARLAVQGHTRAVAAAGKEIALLLASPDIADLGRAFLVGMRVRPHVLALHANPVRVAAAAEAKRRRDRAVSRAVNEIVTYIAEDANNQSSATSSRSKRPASPRILFVGSWLADKKRRRSRNAFPVAKLLEALSRRILLVYVGEHQSTSLCALCSSQNTYLAKINGQRHNGSVRCSAKACPGRGRLVNRDVGAAVTLGNRFVARVLLGGELGACVRACCVLYVWRASVIWGGNSIIGALFDY